MYIFGISAKKVLGKNLNPSQIWLKRKQIRKQCILWCKEAKIEDILYTRERRLQWHRSRPMTLSLDIKVELQFEMAIISKASKIPFSVALLTNRHICLNTMGRKPAYVHSKSDDDGQESFTQHMDKTMGWKSITLCPAFESIWDPVQAWSPHEPKPKRGWHCCITLITEEHQIISIILSSITFHHYCILCNLKSVHCYILLIN